MTEPRRELVWTNKYVQLKHYLLEHHHLPDKRKQENRGLLNWWKYNQKRLKKGICPPEQQRLLEQLEGSTAGRWLKLVLLGAVFALSLLAMTGSTMQAFIYAQF